jgi:hypothetical protein
MVWRIAMITGLHTSRITIKAWFSVIIMHSINSKVTPLNQGPKPQISQSDIIVLKQISDRIANLEGSLLLKSQNHYNNRGNIHCLIVYFS